MGRKPNYNVEKRTKELQRKKKQEEKLRRKRESLETERRDESGAEPVAESSPEQD